MESNDVKDHVKIIELLKSDGHFPRLKYEYVTEHHYQPQISSTEDSWSVRLSLKPLPKP